MSGRATPRRRWLDRLPGPQRDALIGIGRGGRGLFGRSHFQRVFDENLAIFEYLVGEGATATVIGQLLAEIGIARDDGTALPEGTISSALSRARERAARGAVPGSPIPAWPGRGLHSSAADGRAPHATAGGGGRAPHSTELPPHTPVDTQAAPARGDHRFRPTPKEPAAGPGLPEHTRRAAALLGDLRSEQDEGTY